MIRNGKFRCFRCALHLLRMRYDLYIQIYQHSNFHNFRLFFWILIIWWSKFLTRSSSGWVLSIEICLEPSKLSPKQKCNVNLSNFWTPAIFSENCPKRHFCVELSVTRSSSGWVLMVRKVLPSKSSESEENFSYLPFFHISNI